jgi:hypothetical protein
VIVRERIVDNRSGTPGPAFDRATAAGSNMPASPGPSVAGGEPGRGRRRDAGNGRRRRRRRQHQRRKRHCGRSIGTSQAAAVGTAPSGLDETPCATTSALPDPLVRTFSLGCCAGSWHRGGSDVGGVCHLPQLQSARRGGLLWATVVPTVVLSPLPSAQDLAPTGVEAGDVAAPAEFTGPPPVADISVPQPSPLELALQAPPRVSQSVVQDDDETPTPREPARRLAQFPDEVLVQREPPLIASSPRQLSRTKMPLPIRHRSRRIAAQPLAYIPTSKQGAVLLEQRFSKAPPANPGSPAPKSILDALRSETLDAAFPAFNGCAAELFIEDS